MVPYVLEFIKYANKERKPMKIDLSFNSMLVDFKNGTKKKQSNDPFDLNLNVKEIRIEGNESPQLRMPSFFLCTPGCRVTGTHKSFCCDKPGVKGTFNGLLFIK